MKTRQSGMPDEQMWNTFFDPCAILDKLGIQNVVGNIADLACGYGTFTIPVASRTKGLVYAIDIDKDMIRITQEKINEGIVVFIHIEKEDEERENKLKEKAVDNIRWLLKKTNTNTVVLHSFAHLSESKSSPEFAQKLIDKLKGSLEERHFITHVTPYGYFLEFQLHVLG